MAYTPSWDTDVLAVITVTEVATVDQDKLPVPSVVSTCPELPPNIVTLDTDPMLDLPNTVRLPATDKSLSV
jgi:hypothetical protein